MTDKPLAVVIAALVHDGKILLIRRRRGDYVGLWGLPGGKIEKGEHLYRAALREIAEETGIEATFKGYLGLVSERLEEDGRAAQHFLLHLCELTPGTTATAQNNEGELGWFDCDKIGSIKNQIIPSDFLIIRRMVSGREGTYYNCVLHKSGDGYTVTEFRPAT
jgi:8-oxo-dGTP diphosphatase